MASYPSLATSEESLVLPSLGPHLQFDPHNIALALCSVLFR